MDCGPTVDTIGCVDDSELPAGAAVDVLSLEIVILDVFFVFLYCLDDAVKYLIMSVFFFLFYV